MKRFLSVAIILFACFPVGVSLIGCGSNVSHFCNGSETQRTNQIASITLMPEFVPVTIAYTQISALATPTAANCFGSQIAVRTYTWTSSNPSLVDISPSGVLCAGTWNRNSGGGVPDFTICSPPTDQTIEQLLQASNNSYNGFSAQVTASASGVSSNSVTIFSHPQVTSAFAYTVPNSGTTQASCSPPVGLSCNNATGPIQPSQCFSQASGQSVTYCALVCAQALTLQGCSGPAPCIGNVDITAAAGQVSFAPANSNVVAISSTANATPVNPGATLVTASVSGVTAAAGIYSTCPPASMELQIAPGNTSTMLDLPVNISQQLQLITTDSTGKPISLNGLSYTSTTPQTLGISSTGVVTPTFGGNGDVYAACLPPACNPSPINDIGLFATAIIPGVMAGSGGNGVPLISNPINVVTPTTESSIAYFANFDEHDYPDADFFGIYNSQTDSAALISTVYRPNSMVLSQDYSHLYIGTDIGLLSYSTSNSGAVLIGTDVNVPGRVVAISPDGTTLVVSGFSDNDPASPVIYLYTTSTGGVSSFSGTAYSARWSADGDTIYIAGGSQEYVYNKLTGWSAYPTTGSETDVQDVAVLVPPVGAFFSGDNTAARTYCPNTTVTPPVYNPQPPASETGVPSERLGISTDGDHLFGATSSGSFTDFCVAIPTTTPGGVIGATTSTPNCTPNSVAPIAACSPSFAVTATPTTAALPIPAGFNVTGVPVASNVPGGSTTTYYTAFTTYSNCTNTETINESCTGNPPGNGALPYYVVPSGGTGATGSLTLTNPGSPVQPIAPTAGAISPDDTIAFITTSGDNALHIINISQMGIPSENVAINPPVNIGIPSQPTGSVTYLPVDKIVVRPYRQQ